MSGTRPELSKKNPYWIPKHRYYELKHFCLQYNYFFVRLNEIDGLSSKSFDPASFIFASGEVSDPVFDAAEARMYCKERLEMVQKAAIEADYDLAGYILRGVTQGLSYDTLHSKLGMPCGRDTYYDRYRKFFYCLNSIRK